ncbi:MAG: hypothetical protein U9Q74_13580, partial [Gemmatimonadota bacterium]|nr:hypothetical protein [Gemmatimonadota bacterium]
DAHLFTPGPALQWKQMDNRNDEFWGHQTFIGENPPLEAVIAYHLKKPVAGLALRIVGNGRTVRDVEIPAAKNAAGIQMACWDQRVAPIEADSTASTGFGGRGGGGRGGRAGPPAVPGIPIPVPSAGYLPNNPCDDGSGGGGRGGFGGFGGGGTAGPYVAPGAYTVQLVAGGSVLDSKPLTIVGDPAVRLASGDRRKYDDVANDLHELQRRAMEAQAALNQLNREVTAAAPKVRDGASIPANVKSDFEAFTKAFDDVKKKFGAGAAPGAGGRGGGGGRGGAPMDPDNVLGRITQAKTGVLAFWETPSPAIMRQYNEAKAMLPRAIADANGIITRANTLSQALKAQGITLTVPATIK